MKLNSTHFLLALAASATFTACNNDSDNSSDLLVPNVFDAYLLHEGQYGKNNASLSGLKDGVVTPDLYLSANKKYMGDTANDMLLYGQNLYVVVAGSQYLAKLDLYGNEVNRYTFDDADVSSPRYITAYQGDVYVSTYGGYVVKLDTAQLDLQAKLKVIESTSPQLDQMAIIDQRLYVANSGWGSGNTLRVVDLNSFTSLSPISVGYNPQNVLAAEGKLYVRTTAYEGANFKAINRIAQIDPTTGASTDLIQASFMAYRNGILYLIDSNTDDYIHYTNHYYTYNVAKAAIDASQTFLPSEPQALSTAGIYGFNIDPASGQIYITTSDFVSEGKLYVFDAQGTLQLQTSTGGFNASRVVFTHY